MANTMSSKTAPTMKVASMRSLSPLLRAERSSNISSKPRNAEPVGPTPLRMYPAAIPQPMANTGVQASQLHQTERGANSLPYRIQAAAPEIEAPPDLLGTIPANRDT